MALLPVALPKGAVLVAPQHHVKLALVEHVGHRKTGHVRWALHAPQFF